MQPLQDHELHPPANLRVSQSLESLSRDEEQQALCSNTDQHHIPEDEEQEHQPDPPQYQPEVQEVNQSPAAAVDDKEAKVRDLQQIEDSVDRALPQDPDSNLDWNLPTGTADEDEAGEAGGSVPSLVVTETEESRAAAADPVTPVKEAAPHKPERSSEPASAGLSASSLNSSSDGGDMTCSDLLSLRSDSLSLASESNVFKRNEEDDTRSVTTSSIMSLFHRVPLDPLEKEWLKSSAVGNMAAQRHLLAQEPGLVLKKDFITTALHWAAKQGCQEAVDMMLCSGADVNVRSGYTALHLASIHGHQDVVQTLINTYNARTSVRDYHGKTAGQYWRGSTDIFNKPDSQSGGRCVCRRQTQRYALPSLLLSRSRSQGQLNLQFRTPPQSTSHDALDLHV